MTLYEQFLRIKPACDFQSLSPGAVALTFKDGHAFAKNLSLMAKIPFEGVADCVVAAKEFSTAVRAFPAATSARVTPKTVIISKGDTLGTIPRMDVVVDYDDIPLKMSPVPKGFGAAIERVAPFVSKDRTRAWTMGARIDGSKIVATNNVVLVEAAMLEDSGVTKLTLSNSLVEFLASNHAGIESWGISNKEIRFAFKDGGWVRAARLNGEMPDRVPAMLEGFPELAEGSGKTLEWRNEVRQHLAFAEGLITVADDKITGQRDGLVLEVNIETPIFDQPLVFGPELLEVVKHATEIDFTSEDNIPFRGDNFRGIMAPRSITA